MKKEKWVEIADAYAKEARYWQELYDKKIELADKYFISRDFLGNDYFDGPLVRAVEKMLGEDYSYWLFDCGTDFEKFNENVSLEDGSHPDVHSLEGLYDFIYPDGGDDA